MDQRKIFNANMKPQENQPKKFRKLYQYQIDKLVSIGFQFSQPMGRRKINMPEMPVVQNMPALPDSPALPALPEMLAVQDMPVLLDLPYSPHCVPHVIAV